MAVNMHLSTLIADAVRVALMQSKVRVESTDFRLESLRSVCKALKIPSHLASAAYVPKTSDSAKIMFLL